MNDIPPDFEKQLLTVSEGDAGLARRLVALYLQELPGLLTSAREAGANGDLAGLERAAHTIKGSSQTLGFTEVADSALWLEEQARAGELDRTGATRGLARLVRACRHADRLGQAYLGETSADPGR